jgi:two-component system, OmpR family, osmolarity sensor histidine kinase EnvZ
MGCGLYVCTGRKIIVKWLPQTLFGRSALLLGLLLVTSQVGSFLIGWELVQRPRVESFATYARLHADSVRAAITLLPADARAQYIEALNRRGATIAVKSEAPPVALGAPHEIIVDLFLKIARPRLAPDYELHWQPQPQRRLWLKSTIASESYWFGLSADGFLPDTPIAIFAAASASLLLALIGAWLLQRRIHRPLIALTQSVSQVAKMNAPPSALPIAKYAPLEVTALLHGYNAMIAAIAKNERERAEMLAGISHDLRTPLTKLRLGIEMLPEHTDPLLRNQMIHAIETADGVVNQFIDFARPDGIDHFAAVNLNDIARIAARTADNVMLELQQDLPDVLGDANAIARAVCNLVNNAEKYGESDVLIRTAFDETHASIAVLDRGPGIAASEVERLKQPFVRMDAARSGKPGAGLGLAIVSRVAANHGATFDVLPRPGGGLEAKITFARSKITVP